MEEPAFRIRDTYIAIRKKLGISVNPFGEGKLILCLQIIKLQQEYAKICWRVAKSAA